MDENGVYEKEVERLTEFFSYEIMVIIAEIYDYSTTPDIAYENLDKVFNHAIRRVRLIFNDFYLQKNKMISSKYIDLIFWMENFLEEEIVSDFEIDPVEDTIEFRRYKKIVESTLKEIRESFTRGINNYKEVKEDKKPFDYNFDYFMDLYIHWLIV